MLESRDSAPVDPLDRRHGTDVREKTFEVKMIKVNRVPR